MTVFAGESLTDSDYTISVSASTILTNAQNIEGSRSAIAQKEDELETAATDFSKTYDGDSSVEFINAFLVLKYRQNDLQTRMSQVSSALTDNASDNTAINAQADANAGGDK